MIIFDIKAKLKRKQYFCKVIHIISPSNSFPSFNPTSFSSSKLADKSKGKNENDIINLNQNNLADSSAEKHTIKPLPTIPTIPTTSTHPIHPIHSMSTQLPTGKLLISQGCSLSIFDSQTDSPVAVKYPFTTTTTTSTNTADIADARNSRNKCSSSSNTSRSMSKSSTASTTSSSSRSSSILTSTFTPIMSYESEGYGDMEGLIVDSNINTKHR